MRVKTRLIKLKTAKFTAKPVNKEEDYKRPCKAGLQKDERRSSGAGCSSDPSDKRDDTRFFLLRFFFLDDLNLPPTHPSGFDTQAPISLTHTGSKINHQITITNNIDFSTTKPNKQTP